MDGTTILTPILYNLMTRTYAGVQKHDFTSTFLRQGISNHAQFVHLLESIALFTAFIRMDIRVLLVCYYVFNGITARVSTEATIRVMVWLSTAGHRMDIVQQWARHATREVQSVIK